MDEKRLLGRVQYLAHALFLDNPDGKEFIKLMKLLHLLTLTFPQAEDVIARHGGSLAWAAFREGQVTLLRSIELLGQNYLDKLAAENQSRSNTNEFS